MTGKELSQQLKQRVREPGAVLRDLVDAFSEGLLLQKTLSADYFEFAVETLSDPELRNTEGIESFLFELHWSLDLLSELQKADLLKILIENYPNYEGETLCFVVGDFVARAYQPEAALNAVDDLSVRAHSRFQKVGVLMAIDILRKKSARQGTSFDQKSMRYTQRLSCRAPCTPCLDGATPCV
jgi:hypothetical protein